MKKLFLSLVAILCVSTTFVQKANAGESSGYYWYNNKISVYPTGKGLVYATEDSPESLPDSEKYKEELNIQRCTRFVGENYWDPIFHAIAKSTSDYNFVGWYSFNDAQKPETMIKFHSEAWKYSYYGEEVYKEYLNHVFGNGYWDYYAFDGIGKLDYYWSEDNDKNYYDYAPLNSIYAVFGKVNVDFLIDDLEEMLISTAEREVDKESLKNDVLQFANMFAESNRFNVQISKPANDVGDEVTLKYDTDFVEQGDFIFKYWTDSKGKKFYDKELKLTVKNKETYTCHFGYSEGDDDGIKRITGEGKTAIYDLNGIYLGNNTANLQHGCYIINGKVHVVR